MGGLTTLPSIAYAKLPDAYVNAKDALAKCARVDECEDWADREAALASYARQAEDDSLRMLATRIRARAIRRCSTLLRQRQGEEDAKLEAASAEPATTGEEWVRSVVGEAVAHEIEARLAVLRRSA